MCDKKTIRREMLGRRALLTDYERKKAEEAMLKELPQELLWKDARIVLSFASYGYEINTWGINELALKQEKRLYLPKTEGDRLLFFGVDDLKELKPGFKSIPEPSGTSEVFDYKGTSLEKVVIIMPGAVFDQDGNRYGYGGGYYDRYLADKPILLENSIAIGYKCQLLPSIPVEDFDLKVANIRLY